VIIKLFDELALRASEIISVRVSADNSGGYKVVITMSSKSKDGGNEFYTTKFTSKEQAKEWYSEVVAQWEAALAKQEQST
jgi:hypothetical protein